MIEHDTHIIEPAQKPIGTVIWLHGLGADNRNFDTLVPPLTREGALPLRFVFPNAPVRPITINQNMPMRAWYDVYSLTHLDREDEAGIADSQAYLEQLIDFEKQQGIAADRVVLAGFSQGGAMVMHTGLRYPEKLAGIMALSCYLPMFHTIAHASSDPNKDTPIFIGHGEHDPVLPMVASKITHAVLDNTHPNVSWHEYPMGHEICPQEVMDMQRWLAARMGVKS